MEGKPLSIKQNFIWNTLGCLIYQACLWAITVIVVIISGFENSGYLAYAMAIGNIFFPLATYNIRTYQVSDINDLFSQSNYVAIRLATIGVSLLFIVFYVFLTTDTPKLVLASLSWLVFKSDEAFCNVLYGADQKASRMDYIGISQIIRGIGVLFVFTIILLISKDVLLAIISMSFLCICVTFFYDIHQTGELYNIRPSINCKTAYFLLKECLPAMLTLLCWSAVASVARQIFEGMEGTVLLGIYATIATPTILIQVLASYLYSPFIRPISEQWEMRRYRRVAIIIIKVILVVIIALIVLCGLSEIFGKDILVAIYGKEISEYSNLLSSTFIAVAVTALMGFFLDLMIIFRKSNTALYSNIMALLLAIVLSPLCIQAYGMNGINISISASFLIAILFGVALFCRNFSRQHDHDASLK